MLIGNSPAVGLMAYRGLGSLGHFSLCGLGGAGSLGLRRFGR